MAFAPSLHRESTDSLISHVYKDIWTTTIAEELQTAKEVDNDHDTFAVSVMKDAITVGDMPREISRNSWYFSHLQSHLKSQTNGDSILLLGMGLKCQVSS